MGNKKCAPKKGAHFGQALCPTLPGDLADVIHIFGGDFDRDAFIRDAPDLQVAFHLDPAALLEMGFGFFSQQAIEHDPQTAHLPCSG